MPLTASDLIKQWISISDGGQVSQTVANNLFFRFVACWVAFNAYYTRKYGESSDSAGVKACGLDLAIQAFHQDFLANSPQYTQAVQFFKVVVEDMRFPGDQTKGKKVTNVSDWAEVVICVYQVRCNLMHGEKSIDSTRDVDCVRNALQILSPIMKKVEGILPP